MGTQEEREALASQFEYHAKEEGRILERYRALAERSGGGALGFVLDLILTEEEMHHLLLRTMATWLKEPPGREAGGPTAAGEREELLRCTRELKVHEQETIESCRALRSRLSPDERGLLESLVDSMILDSEKHHALLCVVEKLAQA